YGVVTFYSFFTMTPKGRHPLRVCLGTACHVRAGQIILEGIEQALGIKKGEVTSDREFSLDVVRCLGACVLAPVMMVGEDTHKQLKAAKIDRILDTYREGSTNREE
ncbi:MAG: NAD(P)H-dependent oxidoreductase subunit E, partial [Desulfobacterales bacterium]|nr:NAD(P)H-dependent oxidoreductase subunit E [Desulfobacterales bacterium]